MCAAENRPRRAVLVDERNFFAFAVFYDERARSNREDRVRFFERRLCDCRAEGNFIARRKIGDDIFARRVDENVVAFSSRERVISFAAAQRVVAFAADE